MAIFLVTPLSNNHNLLLQAMRERDLDTYEVQNQAGILVSHPGTTTELSQRIGLTPADAPLAAESALITRIDGYYGIASMHMWEWMQSREKRSA